MEVTIRVKQKSGVSAYFGHSLFVRIGYEHIDVITPSTVYNLDNMSKLRQTMRAINRGEEMRTLDTFIVTNYTNPIIKKAVTKYLE